MSGFGRTVFLIVDKGVPQRLVTQVFNARAARQGPGTYDKQGLDWVKVK